MKFKKTAALFLCIVLMLQTLVFAENEGNAKEYKFAQMYFEKNVMQTVNCRIGMSEYRGPLLDGEAKGRFGRWIGPGAFGYIVPVCETDYWTQTKENEAYNVRISVEYFDSGKGKFTLRYPQAGGSQYASKGWTQLTNTGEWKTAEYILTDIGISKSYGDFRFEIGWWSQEMGQSPENVLIGSIKCEEIFPVEPVQATMQTGYLGNMIDCDKRDGIKLSLKNISDSSGGGEISYTITDDANKLISSFDATEFSVDALGTYELSVDVKELKNGLYKLNANLKTEFTSPKGTENAEYMQVIDFSVIPIWTEGEERNAFYGACGHVNSASPSKTVFGLAEAGGFGKARIGIHPQWRHIMTAPGVFDYSYYTDYDYEENIPEGMSQIGILCFGNPAVYKDSRANPNMAMPHTDEEIEYFVQYVAESVRANKKYYGDVPTRWEVWNEPDHNPFNPTGETPEQYAKILKKSYDAIKAVDPDAIVVAGSTINDDVGFLKRVFDAVGTDCFDEISLHPYSFTAKADGSLSAMVNTALSVQELMKEYGEVKPIGFTEIGWHSTEDHIYGVTEQEQARYTVMLPVVTLAYDAAEYVAWYDLTNDGEANNEMEHNFGLTNSMTHTTPYSAKPSFAALSTYNSMMPNAVYKDKVEFDGMRTAAYCFDRSVGDNVAVMWSFDANQVKSLDLGCESVEVYDMYGNHVETLKGSNGVFTFGLTQDPVYVVGKFNKFCEGEPQFAVNDFSEAVVDDLVPVSVMDNLKRRLKVRVEPLSDGIISEDEIPMVNGKADFSIKTAENAEGENKFRVKIYDQNGVYYSSEHTTTIKPLFVATAETVQLSENNNTRWQLKVTVQNMANERVLAGEVELTEPFEYAEAAKKVFFTDLKPKQKRSFYLNLPEIVAKRTVNVKTKVTVDGGYSEEIKNSIDFTTGYYAEKKPTIDGIIGESEWRGDWVYSDKLEYIEGGLEKTWGGVDDLSLKAKFAWDEENFYLLVDVKDNILFNKEAVGSMWMDDCLQWGFDRITPQGEFVSSSFTEMGIGLVDGKPAMNRWSVQDSDLKTGEVTNFEAVINRTETNTIYEVRVPWSEIFTAGYDVNSSSVLGFSLMANDNDGNGRRGWTKYNGGIGLYKAPAEFGRMKLVK